MNTCIVRIELQDGLRMPNGVVHPASYTCVIYCRAPVTWIDGGAVRPEKMHLFFDQLYGADFRHGNEDGSRYVWRDLSVEVLNAERQAERPWLAVDASDQRRRYWFWRVREDGRLARVSAADL